MFCKSGILIFIFAENNYSIYAHAMLIKTPLLHQSFGPRVFLSFFFSLFLSISFWLIPWSVEAVCITQGILASLRLSLCHHRLQTTRFRSIKGPTAVKVFQSICQQIWKTQQWPQDQERSDLIPIPNKGNAKECSNYSTTVFISHASKVMLKILQARFQYMNQELPDV